MAQAARQNWRGERQLRYQQVYQYIVDLIVEHDLQAGDKLPSASDLTARTGVSMISVRRALTELENEGVIYRHQGVGTFVASGRILTAPNRTGELLSSLVGTKTRLKVRNELLSFVVGAASKNIAAALSVKPGEPVWEVRRLRHVGAAALILERAVLPVARVPVLDEAYLNAGHSMYAYLEREYGLSDAATEQAIQVDQPSQEEWRVLGLRASASVVRIRGISFDASGTAFDCYEQVYGASNFVFYITNVDRRELLRPGDRGDWLVEPFGLSRQRDDSEGRADS